VFEFVKGNSCRVKVVLLWNEWHVESAVICHKITTECFVPAMVLANFAEASFNRLLLVVIAKWVTAIAENGRSVQIE
jgi:hypothetical protein